MRRRRAFPQHFVLYDYTNAVVRVWGIVEFVDCGRFDIVENASEEWQRVHRNIVDSSDTFVWRVGEFIDVPNAPLTIAKDAVRSLGWVCPFKLNDETLHITRLLPNLVFRRGFRLPPEIAQKVLRRELEFVLTSLKHVSAAGIPPPLNTLVDFPRGSVTPTRSVDELRLAQNTLVPKNKAC